MKALSVVLLSLLVVGQSSGADPWKGADASIKLTVLDDARAPVTNAVVVGHFASPYGKDFIGDRFDLRTDTNGQCHVVGRGFSSISGRVTAPRHYYTSYTISLGDRKTARTTGQWGVTEYELVLMRVRNPVPMYSGQLVMDAVVSNPGISIGYDFVIGDWVSPHGKGKHSDAVFAYKKVVLRSEKIQVVPRQDDVRGQMAKTAELPLDIDTSLKIIMLNPGDGLLKRRQNRTSEFVSEYEAPSDGYESSVELFTRQRQEKRRWPGTRETNADDDALYYFRVRTELDEHGNVKKAWYGKICGEVNKAPNYYVNPDGTLNVEFDPSRNLSAGGLVREP
jgi:hypothetical protein